MGRTEILPDPASVNAAGPALIRFGPFTVYFTGYRWITFTPESEFVYVSNSGARSVSAVDARTRQIVAVIPVGEVPKRINTLILR